jgi:hypothetical protein
MEYEDSYVYTVAGRQLLQHTLTRSSPTEFPYSISVCAAGSLTSCRESESFPEHFIGDAYILSLCSRIIGYSPDVGTIVSLLAACLSGILIFLISIVVADNVVAASTAVLIFAVTPVFAVRGLETSAEPVSNACISVVLWFYLRYLSVSTVRNSHMNTIGTWCALTASLLLSLTIKRENALLIISLPFIGLLLYLYDRRDGNPSKRKLLWVTASAVLALAFSFQMKTVQTLVGETALLAKFPVTSRSLLRLLPVFLRSFFVLRWYGGGALLVVLGLMVAWRRKHLALCPLLLFAAYVLLYAFHIRSYYEMRPGDVSPYSALRFSMALMTLYSILAGLGAAALIERLCAPGFHARRRWAVSIVALCTLGAALGTSFRITVAMRDEAVEDEFRVRIRPALTAVRFALADGSRRDYIVTQEPILIQMYASPSTNVFDLARLDNAAIKELTVANGRAGFLFLDERINRTPANADRYKDQLRYLKGLRQDLLYTTSEFSVVRLRAE